MKQDNENRSFGLNKIWKIVAVIFVLFLLFHYWRGVEDFVSLIISAATPLIVGFVAAYVINLPMAFFERNLFKKAKSKFPMNHSLNDYNQSSSPHTPLKLHSPMD